MDAARRTESLSSRRLLPSPFFLNSTASVESFLLRGEDASNVAVNSIPPPAYDYKPNPETLLQQTFAVSRRAEQLRLRKKQRIVATAEDSVLRTEMGDPESQEENVPACFGISRWCGSVRSGPSAGMRLGLPVSGRPSSPLLWVRRLQQWDWQTFSLAVGAQIAAIAALPSSICGCKRFGLDALGDHQHTCTAHSGPMGGGATR